MTESKVQIISLEVSPFDYDDYCNLFDTYNNDSHNIELRTIIDNLGFNIDRGNTIIYKSDGDVILAKTASSRTEIDEYMKDAADIMTLGLWTVSKESKDGFEREKTRLFNHSCKVNYQIKCSDLDEIIHIRRIYTMSSRLKTVQMVEFILETDENTNTKRWMYFDMYKLNLFKSVRTQIQDKMQDFLASDTNFFIIKNAQKTTKMDKHLINLYNLILNKYILAINKIYDFYIEKDFEEIDDDEMWEHELFQSGLHKLEC